jgi:hypothetical protein
MNFGQLQTAVYQVCGYPTPVQPVVVQRVKNWLNEAHRHCLRLPGLVELRQRSGLPFTTTAGRSIYALPFPFERIDAVVERPSARRLRAISRDVFRSIDPAETSQGTPTCYAPEGWQPRFAVPNVTPIWAVSSSAEDTSAPVDPKTGPQVRLITIRGSAFASAIAAKDTTYLTGTTRVNVTNNVNCIDIVAFTLSSACVGSVALFDAAVDGTLLALISPGLTHQSYWCVRLWPTPSGAVTYYVDGQIEIPELLHETDVPMLPPSFHDLLAAFARSREYERSGDSRFAVASAEWERGVGLMRASTNFPDDWKPVAGSMSSGVQRTNLGGDFPADWSWP